MQSTCTPPVSPLAGLQCIFMHCRTAVALMCCMLGLATMTPAHAQSWPSRPVTIISPYAPGGTNDVVARLMADRLQKVFGQPFIVENRAGAAGIVGSTAVMRAAPDGYTLLSANNGSLVVQSVVKTPSPYDPATAFTPLVKVADAPNYVGVSSDLPVHTVGEFVALAKREPGKFNYSSSGSGSFGNFMGEYFKLQTGTDIVHIPGKSSASALTEMMAGRIQLMIDPQVLQQRNGSKIRVLATTQGSRVEAYPDLPTIRESGGPELNIVGWFGLFGPANLPREVVEKIEAAARSILADPEARKTLAVAGLVPSPVYSVQFGAMIRDDVKRYQDIKTRSKMVIE
ncbi:Bug family tripartite tricarboxylate transporter substrate binding protein [Polaromonas sp.]|uniref:Bug family tripartite tricarboxylate transporter substrate binding protein n=1 Tax=Polaromonas sp. TaxID=1869339 RepID=UPI003BA8E0D5